MGEGSEITSESVFAGRDEVGALLRNSFGDALRSLDWSQTSLGAVETWSDSLKTAVQILVTELDQAQKLKSLDSDVPQERTQIDAFRVKLSNALRLLTDANEIQSTAARILGDSLGASRVIYTEVLLGGQEGVVHKNYTNGVAELKGLYPLEDLGHDLTDDHQAKPTIVSDVANCSEYASQKARYRSLEIAAHINVPLIKNHQLVALLTVHQATPRQWTAQEVQRVEETAEQTWAAVERARAEVVLRQSEAEYRTLFESIDEGFCVCQLLFDENGEPDDHRILKANAAFERLTGLENVTGKTARELVPDLEADFLKTFANVVRTGEPIRFEQQSIAMNRWFDLNVFRIGEPQSHQFAILFTNITDRKRTELNREFLATISQALVETVDVDEIVQTVGRELNRYLQISACAFVEINQQWNEAIVNYDWHQGDQPSLIGVYTLLEMVTEEFLQAIKAGEPIVIRNYATDPRITDLSRYTALNICAEVNIPLIRNGKWRFSLAVFHAVSYDWREDEIELMQELASRIWAKLERARAEAALRQSRAELEQQVQKFNVTLSTITDFVFSFDLDGRVLYANQGLLDLWGVTAAEASGKTLAELSYPEASDRAFMDSVFQVFETRKTVKAETPYTNSAGIGGYFEYSISPVFAADGTVEFVVGSSRNISDRKQVEEALRQSETRFRRIFECEMVPMAIYTKVGGIIEANNSLLNLIGYTRQELETGQISWQALTPPEYRSLDEIALSEIAVRGVSTPYEKVYLHKDGRRIPILIGAALLHEDASSGVFFAIDLTERKQAEAALQEQSQLMQLILTNIGDGLVMANRQGKFVLFNQAAERMFGRLTDEQSLE
ncbi:PAS domain S-box protein, partial [Leptolyngbya sp. FACHB-36]|uniref:PAS domain S-box protein n=1 Tax=Leptolyngbya sp. FACHB-36 TaxID=2692808 RepID=UPI0016802BA6